LKMSTQISLLDVSAGHLSSALTHTKIEGVF
jgi:hypothetical protein